MKIKIKKLHENAVIPHYATTGSAGMDIVAIGRNYVLGDEEADFIEYQTGLSFEIPEGYVGLLFPRSSNSKKDLTLCNSVGIIDSDFRGEVTLRYKIDAAYNEAKLFENMAICEDFEGQFGQYIYEVGDRVGQIVILPYPKIEFEESELTETKRADGGYGHTGR